MTHVLWFESLFSQQMAGFTRVLSPYLIIDSRSFLRLNPILTLSERDGSLTPLDQARREVDFLIKN